MVTTQSLKGCMGRALPPEFRMQKPKISLVLKHYLEIHDSLDRLVMDCIMLSSQIADITEKVMKAKQSLQKLYDEEIKDGSDTPAN